MKKLRNLVSISLVVSALVFVFPFMAIADSQEQSYEESVKELVRLNPGSRYDVMDNAIKAEAKMQDKSVEDIAKEALSEARENDASYNENIATRSSSGDVTLSLRATKGDIFYSPSKVGHVGIYYNAVTIIEAPGPAWWNKVRKRGINQVTVKTGTEIMHVRTSQNNRNRAANKANTYVGDWYNTDGFAFNKRYEGRKNCSQLVWAAYKSTTGIDLDGDGGHGVYPRDIKKSKWTYTYKYRR